MQAIEEAIARGLPRVEAGAQGEHKLQRGYLPNFTYSAHYMTDPTTRAAVAKFLDREEQQVRRGGGTMLARMLFGCMIGSLLADLQLQPASCDDCWLAQHVFRLPSNTCSVVVLKTGLLLLLPLLPLLQLAYTWQALTLEGSPFKQDKVRGSTRTAALPAAPVPRIRVVVDTFHALPQQPCMMHDELVQQVAERSGGLQQTIAVLQKLVCNSNGLHLLDVHHKRI